MSNPSRPNQNPGQQQNNPRPGLTSSSKAALAACGLWIVPTLWHGDPALVRLQATEFLLLAGAAVIIVVERQIAQSAPTHILDVPAPAGALAGGLAACDQAALVTLPAVHAALP